MSLALLGCDDAPTTSQQAGDSGQQAYSSSAVYQVGKVFKGFYQRLGGEALVGPCLSAAFDYDGKTYQYTSTVLMIYDPNQAEPKRLALVALGYELGVAEPPKSQPGGMAINGYRVWEEIVPLYERFGREIIGTPLTNMRYNAELRRYEQYFENMGFYRYVDDPTNSVHLLSYGAKVCGTFCSYISTRDAVPDKFDLPLTPAELLDAENTIGDTAARIGVNVTGNPITPVYQRANGLIEQIFENMVFVINPADVGRADILPLRDALGLRSGALETQNDSDYFYALDGDRGYNIPPYFMDYITQHGGIEIFGYPFTQEIAVSDRVTRQCFINLCLEFHRTAPELLRIRPQPIGYIYRDLNYQPLVVTTPTPTYQSATLKTWEAEPLIPLDHKQVIWAAVYDNNIPIDGIELRLTLTLPDGTQQTKTMPLTDAQGQSYFTLPLIKGANGTLVPYQVCVTSVAMDKLCDQQSFILWDNP